MASFRVRKRRGVVTKIKNQSGDIFSFPKDIWIKGVQYSWPTSASAGFMKSSASAALSFASILASDISGGTALTKVDDINVTIALGGTPATALLAPTSLTLGWAGTLAAARGGTGIGNYTTGDLLYASGAATLAKLPDVAAGSYLRSGGIALAPAWSVVPASEIGSGAAVTAASTRIALAGSPAAAALAAFSIDVTEANLTHNNIGGLTIGDPHTQYSLLAGRGGGQILYGGNLANDDITIEGTSHITKAASYVLLQPNGGSVGVGTLFPDAKVKIVSNSVNENALYVINSADVVNGFTPLWRFQTSSITNRGIFMDVFNAGGIGEYLRMSSLGNIPIFTSAKYSLSDDFFVSARQVTVNSVDTANTGGIAIRNRGLVTPQIFGIAVNNSGSFYVRDDIVGAIRLSINILGNISIGATDAQARLHIPSGGLAFDEETDLAAPAINRVIIYARDNGAGKTQVVARFNTGVVQVLATEP